MDGERWDRGEGGRRGPVQSAVAWAGLVGGSQEVMHLIATSLDKLLGSQIAPCCRSG